MLWERIETSPSSNSVGRPITVSGANPEKQDWLIGIQIASLIAIGSLLFSILGKLPG